MNNNPKRNLLGTLVAVGAVATIPVGALIFVSAVGVDDSIEILGMILGYILFMAITTKFIPTFAPYILLLSLIPVGISVFTGIKFAESIELAYGVPLVCLFFWGIFKLGERLGWWKQTYPPKY